MSADLRRLAEAGIAGTVGRVTPETWQTILALLDERDAYRGLIGTLAEWQAVAERRVAALEDGLRELLAGGIYSDIPGEYLTVQHSHAAWDEARALLRQRGER